ncbi:lipopolysaccharide heptosyltransferase I [Helicobacter sp. 11S02596-1]|uniref:lipopolysaccharide heptosyltransferase I n=1 Tax=Helicobacter sp. 11S02596-1 TaxID=1476194 RepID=UPI000BA6AD94|nr:lipopolysaccharide heptosyltransferase I [Helicobacter sp. 11S02596-1]PAF44675.1 lipopolysaccharide heptosyltransferase I [Helicobacter sp. 11S02596-1]
MKVAIVRLSALGDIIVSAVFLPYLKAIRPDMEIHWFVDEVFGGILEDSPCIAKLWQLPLKKISKSKNIFEAFRMAKNLRMLEKYDVVIDLQGLIKSSVIGSMLKKDRFIGFDKHSIREKIASVFYNQKVSIPYENNILERNMALFEGVIGAKMGLENCLENRKNAFGYSSSAGAKINDLFLGEKRKIVLFVLEASNDNKSYPIEQYAKLAGLIKDLNLKIVLLWYGYFDRAQKLRDQICHFVDVLVLPKLDLDTIKALIARVDLVVGGDTGVTHLSWAMQRASITLYGNTPVERFELRGEKNISLSGNLKANYDKNDFSIRAIPPEDINEAMRRIL